MRYKNVNIITNSRGKKISENEQKGETIDAFAKIIYIKNSNFIIFTRENILRLLKLDTKPF